MRYFSISDDSVVCGERAFLHLPSVAWTGERFCVYSADHNARGATICHIIPNASLSFNRARYHLPFKEDSLFSTVRLDEKEFIPRMENIVLFRCYPLNEFCFNYFHCFSWNDPTGILLWLVPNVIGAILHSDSAQI